MHKNPATATPFLHEVNLVMSRTYILVPFPEYLNEKEAAQYVFERVWPYNRDSSPFDEPILIPCYVCCDEDCYGVHIADKQAGRLQKHWRTYKDLAVEQKISWSTYIEKWQQVAMKSCKLSPHYQKPDPSCSACKGKGVFETAHVVNGKIDYFTPVHINFSTSTIWHIQEIWDDISITESKCIITPDGDWHEYDYGHGKREIAQEILKNFDDSEFALDDPARQEKVQEVLRSHNYFERARIESELYKLRWPSETQEMLKSYDNFRVARILAHV